MTKDLLPSNLSLSICEKSENVATVTLNRPSLRNTLSVETLQELTNTFYSLNESSTISVIILRGLGEAFAAGADIKELLMLTPSSAESFSLLGGNLFRTISNSPKLVIAAIDGFCMGGGLDLALSCDLCYASKKAVFAHPGANIGIVTGFGGTYRLPKLIGITKANQLFATAERINAEQALEIGLIQDLTNLNAYDLAIEKAIEIAKKGQQFIKYIKNMTRIASENTLTNAALLLNYYHQLETRKI